MKVLRSFLNMNPGLKSYLQKKAVSRAAYDSLSASYRQLLEDHQHLERDKRNADKEIFRLLDDPQIKKVLEVLKRQNFFLVGDFIIEAPHPPVSPHIRDALAANGYESVELYLASKLVRPGDTVLDLGSGLGLCSMAAARAAQGGRIVGYEADPRVAQLAQSNADRNGLRVEIRNSAVSTAEGNFTFYQAPDFLANSMLAFEGGVPINVPCADFRKVLAELRPNVITCDIEGVERDLFDGVDLSSVRRVVLEVHEHFIGPAGVQKCINDLAASGLKKVEPLCWGPVLVFDRDGLTTEIPPFTITPKGAESVATYHAPFALHDVADPEIFDDPYGCRQSTNVAKGAPIVWYSPNWLYWWGGGIYTILRFAKLISDRGLRTIIYVYDNAGFPTLKKLRADLNEAYPGHNIELTTDLTSIPAGHIAIATTHQSVFSVLRAPPCAARFYFMQEFESLLYTGGTQAEQANATYQLGFKGICGGDWLRSIFQSYGGKAIKFDFSIDSSIFYPGRAVRDRVERLFFFGRPSSDRRMYDLGVAALQAIHHAHPDVEIIIAGLDNIAKLPFPATYLGNLTIKETGDLYRTCDMGITLSGSNLSYLPLELMACSVPVLTNRGPQLDWYCKHLENSYCSYPFASSFLKGFNALSSSKELRQSLVKNGLVSVTATTWELEAEKIRAFVETEVGWRK